MASVRNKVEIDFDDINDLIASCGNDTCGKILKRIDILNNKEALKCCIKELVYEGFRNFKHMLKAYEKGSSQVTHYKFRSPKK